MRFLHIADTHLGFSMYRKVTADGVNQREMDVYNAFQQIIDYAIETKPDFILHAGDLFDSVRPNNRAISFAIHQLLRLSKEKIPFIVIAGNHEHPRLKETGHIFSLLDHIEYIYPVYRSTYEKINLNINGEVVTIHAIPQTYSAEEFQGTLRTLKPDDSDYNILLLHGSISEIKEFSMREFNELLIPRYILTMDFNYIALGHYHIYTRVTRNTFYSGSTETLSFAEAGSKKGFIEVSIDKNKSTPIFKPLSTRPVVDLPPINCLDLSVDKVMEEASKIIQSINLRDSIVRLTFENLPMHVYKSIDFHRIREEAREAFHFEVKTTTLGNTMEQLDGGTKIDVLSEEFRRYLAAQRIQDKEELLKLGLSYLNKIEGVQH